MNHQITKALRLLVLMSMTLEAHANATVTLKNDQDRISYGIGVDIARNFKRLDLGVHLDAMVQGLNDAYTLHPLMVPDNELRVIMARYQSDLKAKQAKATQKIGEVNLKAETEFLEKNAQRSGVVSLPSGLQYQVIKVGSGPKPQNVDLVKCQFRGTLLDGLEYDSSERTGGAVTFAVKDAIAGWKEGLMLMPVGSKWILYLPSTLAYGSRGAGRDIGPNATLLIELELLAINDAAAPRS